MLCNPPYLFGGIGCNSGAWEVTGWPRGGCGPGMGWPDTGIVCAWGGGGIVGPALLAVGMLGKGPPGPIGAPGGGGTMYGANWPGAPYTW